VIAETVRLRRDLPAIDTVTDLTRELALLTAHRADPIADRVRMINRLRDVMTSVFPTLGRAARTAGSRDDHHRTGHEHPSSRPAGGRGRSAPAPPLGILPLRPASCRYRRLRSTIRDSAQAMEVLWALLDDDRTFTPKRPGSGSRSGLW
jgi:hypothetical protein